MRPKKTIAVVGIRPELPFILRIALPANVWQAEQLPELVDYMRERRWDEVVIVDRRDNPDLAQKAVNYLHRFRKLAKIILITGAQAAKSEPDCDITIRDGLILNARLLECVKLALARKRGPKKGSHQKVCQS